MQAKFSTKMPQKPTLQASRQQPIRHLLPNQAPWWRMPLNRYRTLLSNSLALLGGAAIFILILSFPWTIALASPGLRESLFALVVIGGALGFGYGLGFRAKTGVLGVLLSPATVFTIISAGLLWIAYALSVGPNNLP